MGADLAMDLKNNLKIDTKTDQNMISWTGDYNKRCKKFNSEWNGLTLKLTKMKIDDLGTLLDQKGTDQKWMKMVKLVLFWTSTYARDQNKILMHETCMEFKKSWSYWILVSKFDHFHRHCYILTQMSQQPLIGEFSNKAHLKRLLKKKILSYHGFQ